MSGSRQGAEKEGTAWDLRKVSRLLGNGGSGKEAQNSPALPRCSPIPFPGGGGRTTLATPRVAGYSAPPGRDGKEEYSPRSTFPAADSIS